MKNVRMILIAGAASLMLAGCNTSGGGSAPIVTPTQVSDVIAKVQEYTKTACKFIPAADTVAKILDALGYGGGVSAITAAGVGICDSVTKVSTKRGARPTFKGVPIKGRFVS